MTSLFSQPMTYSEPETPNVRDIQNNADGSETVSFHASTDTTYTYTVTITDAYNDVHVFEAAPGAPGFPGNDYYGVLTGYSNGGDFTVQNYTEGSNHVSNNFVWLFTQAYDSTGSVTLYNDVRAGTFVPPVCFVEGTRIRTEIGEVVVENLAIGDRVVTASGELRPIRWLGRRTYTGRFLAANPDAQPIRFSAGSLGGGLPRRDLVVSAKHAMLLDGVLVPAECLVNGQTILRDLGRTRVDYVHVELDSHDAILAEGAASESYVDDDNRCVFHNASEWAALYPGHDAAPAVYCAPRVEGDYALEVIRRRLAVVAGETARAA